MGFDQVLAYLAAGGGLAIVVVVAWIVNARDIDRELAIRTLLRIAGERNLSRARKLCASAPGSFFDAVGAALASIESTPREPAALELVAFPAFDDRARQLTQLREAQIEVGLIGVLLAATGLALAAHDGAIPTGVLVLVGIAGLGGVWLWLRRPHLAGSLALARAKVVPAIIEAALAGEAPPKVDAPYRSAGEPSAPPAPRIATPAPAKPGTSLRDGTCPLCGHAEITRVDGVDDPRFHKLVCASCGYAQEFADLAQL